MSAPRRHARGLVALGLAAAAIAVGLALALTSGATTGAASGPAPSCVPSALDRSAALAGGAVTVSPAPDSVAATYRTQVSMVGAPAGQIADVRVVGSRSGRHAGRLAAYSQGDGASFLPNAPFAPGERVTVTASLRHDGGATPIAWHFRTAVMDTVSRSLETPPPPPPPPRASEVERFVSRPELAPPRVAITTRTGAQAPGEMLLAPYAGPGQYGPMILDNRGGLVWFKPIPKGSRAADLRVQRYEGRPALTWWQNPLVAGGRRDAGIEIYDSSYRQVRIVRAGNGYQPDLHAFEITPRGTALMTVYDAIRCNLHRFGGPAEGAIADTLLQELDLRTGLVRFEWHSLDHVSLRESYMPLTHSGTPTSPWDFFHINSIDPEPNGDLLVDSRNTWAAYEIDPHTGQIVWRLGGKNSNFRMGPGAKPAWQHDAERLSGGTISFFDNGATPRVHPQSRAIVLHLDPGARSATLAASFEHARPLVAPSQGNLQALADGHWFVGWSQEPFFSEYSSGGRLLLDGHLPRTYQTFTVFKFPWDGRPAQPPAMTARRGSRGVLVAASWNGATGVARWRVLAGASPAALAPVTTTPRTGFETTIAIPGAPRYVSVQALDSGGGVLGSSAPAALGSR
jgi:hypothetical protein